MVPVSSVIKRNSISLSLNAPASANMSCTIFRLNIHFCLETWAAAFIPFSFCDFPRPGTHAQYSSIASMAAAAGGAARRWWRRMKHHPEPKHVSFTRFCTCRRRKYRKEKVKHGPKHAKLLRGAQFFHFKRETDKIV